MSERGWALVTGAGRRIGRILAFAAARAGYDVMVHHRASAAAADETVREIEALGRRALSAGADLGDGAACARLIAGVPEAPTLLVNSASAFENDGLETLSPQVWETALAVNLRAPVLLSQAFAARLPGDARGLIVNVVDQRVLRPTPLFFSYGVSKAALWAATQMMAQALAPRIRVNAIGPGPTLQSIHQSPLDFAAEAASVLLEHGPALGEIGDTLAYLIDAPSVTGQMIVVDGGQHLAWRTPDVTDG